MSDLAHLDQVKNSDGPLNYPINMPIYETGKRGLKWEQKTDKGTSASGDLGVAVPSTAVTAELDAQLAFGNP